MNKTHYILLLLLSGPLLGQGVPGWYRHGDGRAGDCVTLLTGLQHGGGSGVTIDFVNAPSRIPVAVAAAGVVVIAAGESWERSEEAAWRADMRERKAFQVALTRGNW